MRMRTYTVFCSDPAGRDFVVQADDGSKIENITEFTMRGRTGELVTLELEIMGVAANVQAVLTDVNMICPNCTDVVFHTCEPNTLSGGP